MELFTVKVYLFVFSIIVIFESSVAQTPNPFPFLGLKITKEVNIARDKSGENKDYDKIVNISDDEGIDIFGNITIMNYVRKTTVDKSKLGYDCGRFERLLANARRAVKVLKRELESYPDKKKIMVIGGYGDLGFYAFYMARILIEKEFEVTVVSFPSSKGRRQKHGACDIMYNTVAAQLLVNNKFNLIHDLEFAVGDNVTGFDKKSDEIIKVAVSVDFILEAHNDGEKSRNDPDNDYKDENFTKTLLNDMKKNLNKNIISLNAPLADKADLCIYFDGLPLVDYYKKLIKRVSKMTLVVDKELYKYLDTAGADVYKNWKESAQGNKYMKKGDLFMNPDAEDDIFECKLLLSSENHQMINN